jgi:hypothetical protein
MGIKSNPGSEFGEIVFTLGIEKLREVFGPETRLRSSPDGDSVSVICPNRTGEPLVKIDEVAASLLTPEQATVIYEQANRSVIVALLANG